MQLTRKELYDRVWKTPVDTLAKELGLSGRGLGKLCERHGIPVPPRGYWARKAAGQRVVRPPLLDITGNTETPLVISVSRSITRATDEKPDDVAAPVRDPLLDLWEEQLAEIATPRVTVTLPNPHRIVAGWIEEECQRKKIRRSSPDESWFPRAGNTPVEKRRLKILSTLFKELEARGFKIEQDRQRPRELCVRHGQDEVAFELEERIRQYRRDLAPEERTRPGESIRNGLRSENRLGI